MSRVRVSSLFERPNNSCLYCALPPKVGPAIYTLCNQGQVRWSRDLAVLTGCAGLGVPKLRTPRSKKKKIMSKNWPTNISFQPVALIGVLTAMMWRRTITSHVHQGIRILPKHLMLFIYIYIYCCLKRVLHASPMSSTRYKLMTRMLKFEMHGGDSWPDSKTLPRTRYGSKKTFSQAHRMGWTNELELSLWSMHLGLSIKFILINI